MGKHVDRMPVARATVVNGAAVLLAVSLIVGLVVLSMRSVDSGSVAPDVYSAPSLVATTPPSLDFSQPDSSVPPTAAKQPSEARKKRKAISLKLRDEVEKLTEQAPAEPTQFRVTSLNILGASHTLGGARGRKFASGTTRAGYVVDLINSWDVDVAGLQELQSQQWSVIGRQLPGWGSYGPQFGREVMANSIIWDSAVWELVEGNTVQIPYFGGNRRAMPYVLLRNLVSDQQVWFANFHNPADAHGPAARFRAEATNIEIGLANALTADGTPLVFTGDFNDRAEYFCPIVAGTLLESSSGGSGDAGCSPPGQMDVDWVFGSPPIEWTQHIRVIDGLIDRTTDHPMIVADALIPAPSGGGETGS